MTPKPLVKVDPALAANAANSQSLVRNEEAPLFSQSEPSQLVQSLPSLRPASQLQPSHPHEHDSQESKRSRVRSASEVKNITAVVSEEFPELPKACLKEVSDLSKNLESRIMQLQSTNALKEKLQSEFNDLELRKYPLSMKPYKPYFECPVLDSVPSIQTISIKIEDSASGIFYSNNIESNPDDPMTYRGLLEAFHRFGAAIIKKVEMDVCAKHRESLRSLTAKPSFLNEVSKHLDSWSRSRSSMDLVIDSDDEIWSEEATKLKKKATTLYKKVVNQATIKKYQNDKLEEEQKKKRSDVVDELAKVSPQELFEKAVEDRVKAILRRPPPGLSGFKVDYAGMYVNKDDDDYEIEDHVSSRPNGKSPTLPGAKRGKGKGKSKSKGKGKGKSKNKSFPRNSTPFGKGKGKKGKGKGKGNGPPPKARGRGRGRGKGRRKGGKFGGKK